ncbi:DUF6387 family protein [Pseudomonas sp. WC2]|uniref:DUF6387 family protein n=1 Tax=Pseudomonas sp. WC2 TaxID=3424773 RepID=UPI003D34D87E
MAKITRLQNLPGWFDLKKYKGAESFRAFEWMKQLERRSDLLRHYPGGDYSQDVPELLQDTLCMTWQRGMEEGASQIWDTPIEEQPESMPNQWISDSPCLPVKPVSMNDLARQMARDKQAVRDGKVKKSQYHKWAAINSEIQPLPERSPVIPLLHGVLPSGQTTPLSIDYYEGAPASPVIQVDLSVPDSVLKKAFAALLKEARAAQSCGPKGKNKMYDRWVRYGLLPYLDLRIWELLTGNRINRVVMADAVGYVKGDSSFNNTVVPLANGLMRDLSELRALAAVEAVTQAPADSVVFED